MPRSSTPRRFRIAPLLTALCVFATAAALSGLGAVWAVTRIEKDSSEAVQAVLRADGADWAAVRPDGLQVHLTGTAPSEAARFRVLNAAGSVVEASRVVDGMQVAAAAPIAAPRFSVELLRNEDGISLIGLIPADVPEGQLGRTEILAELAAMAPGEAIADMLQTASHAVPEGWDRALGFGLEAARSLPRAKISIAADGVTLNAIAGSVAEQRRLEAALARARPEGLAVDIRISAPRPVISPFTLRFVIDAKGARFDACSADTEDGRTEILRAAATAGMTGPAACTLGLGVPSPHWAEAVAIALGGLDEIGKGTLTFSDADVSLIAGPGVTQAAFDRVVGDLEARLPDVFSLQARRPEPVTADEPEGSGPPEFTATRAPEGKVELRGRLTDVRMRSAVDSYAQAAFGAGQVYTAARLDPDLPEGWPKRVFAGLSALAVAQHGALSVRPDLVEVTGVTGNPDGAAEVARLLSAALGPGQAFRIDLRYDKTFDPDAALPTPQECLDEIAAALTRQKISFDPGEATFAAEAGMTLDAIAQTLRRCPPLRMEVSGHTDAQGRDSMNLALSQSRAEAVVEALRARRAPVAEFAALGLGETRPVADNESPEGREANRRIEFALGGLPPKIAVQAPAPAELAAIGEPMAPSEDAAEDGPAAPAQAGLPAAENSGQLPGAASGQDTVGVGVIGAVEVGNQNGASMPAREAALDGDSKGQSGETVEVVVLTADAATLRPRPRPQSE